MRVLHVVLLWFWIMSFCIGQAPIIDMSSMVGSPVDYSFSLSGNFGELRATHFHTGIDIKPNRSGEVKIMSVADGYISRIAIGTGGYGHCLYIDHPSVGLTSVYAHLERYNPHIAAAIYNYQLNNESFVADIKFEPHLIPVSKGEVIGIMGNTGYSFGRHLHFELRETTTEKPINPFKYNLIPKDDIAPHISSLAIHGLNEDFQKIYDRRYTISHGASDSIKFIEPIKIPAGNIGIALQVHDKADNSYSKNGIYRFNMYVNGGLYYHYALDTLSFDQNRQINGFFDNAVRNKEDKTYSLCYRLPGNELQFLDHNSSGLIYLGQDENKEIIIETADYFDNKRVLKFAVQGTASDENQVSNLSPHIKIYQGKKMKIDTVGAFISFEEGSLFRNTECKIIIDSSGTENTYVIGEESEPIKSPIKIGIRPRLSSDKDPSKAIIVNRSSISYGGEWVDGYLTADVRHFGRYKLDYDMTAPSIRSVSFTSSAHKRSSFAFTIKDNYSTRGDDVEEISYKVWIDGVFVVCPYRQLNSTLTIPIENVGPGEHTLKIEAKDHSGNLSYFDSVFKR